MTIGKDIKSRVVLLALSICLLSLQFGCAKASEPKPKVHKTGKASMSTQKKRVPNHLIHEKSPYLLQHAYNPVDWYPWGPEAFKKAQKEGKPIFLSIGYATCHWCHVMEHESFENEEIAKILNRSFVAIKVDREERPDVDSVYMTYVQAATGGGGWPMSVWLTPELKPFMGGTYYPPEERYGQPGFRQILLQIAQAWKEDRPRIQAFGDTIIQQLRQATDVPFAAAPGLKAELLDQAWKQIHNTYDAENGGFGGPPKFPQPATLGFALRYFARTGEQEARDSVLVTLRKMAAGGMHDQLGGGFHRYAVDAHWQMPHFEKMLYNQALLTGICLDAFQLTHDPFFADLTRDILTYVQRDMTGPQGQFYSAEDADSPNPDHPETREEGAFYVWTAKEIAAILKPDQAAVFNYRYGVEPHGNVAPRDDPHHAFTDKNILHIAHSIDDTAKRFKQPVAMVQTQLNQAKAVLFQARAKRPRPRLDDKTITAWNGLMISAFARAYQVLDDPEYLKTARAAADFIHTRLYNEKTGALLRRYRDNNAAIPAYSRDYTFLIQGLLDLYEADFYPAHLAWAIALQQRQDQLFLDKKSGGYFDTTGTDQTILLRLKTLYDNAEPSANSVSTLNLLRLAQLTGRDAFHKQAEKILHAFSHPLSRAPGAAPQMLTAFDYVLDKPMQIIIAGAPDAPATRAMLKAVHQRFIPGKIVILVDGGKNQRELEKIFPFITSIQPVRRQSTAYVCQNQTCQSPTTDLATLERLLKRKKTSLKSDK